ncbi:MAG: hypothetical protein GF355_12725 [Candidatus Eisenbacteria bacterium]|nr:hypothetical protein [Candidatus Eisenbacteria bacterium]
MGGNRMKRTWIALVATFAVVGLTVGAQGVTYEVLIENDIPGGADTGQPMTPPVVVVHGDGYSLFAEGAMATDGLELLAEEGMTADLVAEAEASPDVYEVQVGDGPFVDQVTVMIEGEPGQLISAVTMLARSNDLITGVHDITLPDAKTLGSETNVYDAGTEQNTGLVEDIPFYGNTFVGPEEEMPIAEILSYEVVNDPDHGTLTYEFPPSATITIRPVEPTPTQTTTWGGMKAGQ